MSLVPELLREQGDGERAPRELGVLEQRVEEERGAGEALGRRSERAQRRLELGTTARRVEVGGESGDPWALQLELSVRISAGGEDEERPPERGAELLLRERDVLRRNEREHRAGLPVAPFTERGLELLQHPLLGRHARQMYDRCTVREVLAQLDNWLARGERAALATVIETRHSAPRPLGSRLAVSESGLLFGSVSGGCVESDVAIQAREVIAGGEPRVLPYGIADEDARSVGLPCGGEIDVFVAPVSDRELVARLREAVEEGVRGRLTTVVRGEGAGEMVLDLDGDAEADRPALVQENGRMLFVEPLAPPPLLLAIGAVDLAEALCALAAQLGWRSVVADPRRALLTPERLPTAGALIDGWPEDALARAGTDDRTAVVVLAHDEKIDIPALSWALRSEAFYVGALGSRRTQAKRRERLREEGLSDADLDRLSGPAGLDLGGETLEETALSILAEIVAARRGRGGGRLRDAKAAVHGER
jgi:xanthine dehydrogenase accessory factor